MRSLNDYIPALIQLLVLVYILIRLYQTNVWTGRAVSVIFFSFAIVSWLLSDLYWVAYDLLHPLTRMPFAANEIAEWAIFISLGVTLAELTGPVVAPIRAEVIGIVLFMTVNVALWIAWSGEWVQDIMTGIALAYCLIHLTRHMRQTGVLSRTCRIALGLVCLLIIAANAATFCVPEKYTGMLELTAYILMILTELYFTVRSVIALTGKGDRQVFVSLSFAAHAWCPISMYMSSGVFYNIEMYFFTFSALLMFTAIRREATA
ncbi:MAG: hypothetical protein K6B72_00565 [Lachnospiraceae bacterium]|nr:hypothetical protein [Lachnospiraceae bacterium]